MSITRTVRLDEPLITDEEYPAYRKWLKNPDGGFPYKYSIRTYCQEKGLTPEDIVGPEATIIEDKAFCRAQYRPELLSRYHL